MESKNVNQLSYTVEFRQQIIREYQLGYSLGTLSRKYNIKGKMTVARWLQQAGIRPIMKKCYLAQIKSSVLQEAKSTEDNHQPSERELQQQIKVLQKQLLDAELRAEMLERMMQIAEQDYKLSIRKKPNTK